LVFWFHLAGDILYHRNLKIKRRFFIFLHFYIFFRVQYNVVSAETLRDAQKNPDQYKNLVVRVAGYSAFFVELWKDLQDDIISRTEHAI